MGSSRSFASTTDDIGALFRLGFPLASTLKVLTAPSTVTRRIIMQKARRQAFTLLCIALRQLVGTWFQVQFLPSPGFFPSFSRPTEFTIGRLGVFSLTGWSP